MCVNSYEFVNCGIIYKYLYGQIVDVILTIIIVLEAFSEEQEKATELKTCK